jgi:hypothetical protein
VRWIGELISLVTLIAAVAAFAAMRKRPAVVVTEGEPKKRRKKR